MPVQELKYVFMLEQVGKEDLAKVGSKGTNLGEMLRAGLPVPKGFVLMVNSYQRYVEANDLGKEIAKILTVIEDGHRANEELEMGYPRWMEEAEQTIVNIASRLKGKGAGRDLSHQWLHLIYTTHCRKVQNSN